MESVSFIPLKTVQHIWATLPKHLQFCRCHKGSVTVEVFLHLNDRQRRNLANATGKHAEVLSNG